MILAGFLVVGISGFDICNTEYLFHDGLPYFTYVKFPE